MMSQEGRNPSRPTQDGSKIKISRCNAQSTARPRLTLGWGPRLTPRQKEKGPTNRATCKRNGIWAAFKLAAHIVVSPFRASRSIGPMTRGELYAYYKRNGMLAVFFALFPGG